MEDTKKNKIQVIKSRLKRNKKRIFMGIWSLFVFAAIISIYDNFYLRFWSDFFLGLFLLIIWLWFFPFTYPIQEKLFWKSLFSASLFTSTMFLVFVFSSFSILMSLFQWDMMLTIWSVLYVLIILLWRSFVLPITATKWVKLVWKKIIPRRKWIFIFFIVANISIFTFDMTNYLNWNLDLLDDDTYTSSEQKNSNHCYASTEKIYNDDRIDVYISMPNNWWKVKQNSFSIEDIKKLEYYIWWESVDKQYYFNREVCNKNEDKPILPIMYDGGMPVDEIYPWALWWSIGNTSSFENLDFEIWDYAINVFVSDNDSDRKFAKTISFRVGQ